MTAVNRDHATISSSHLHAVITGAAGAMRKRNRLQEDLVSRCSHYPRADVPNTLAIRLNQLDLCTRRYHIHHGIVVGWPRSSSSTCGFNAKY